MNLASLRRAEVLLDGLTIGDEKAHTPEFIRTVRDAELLTVVNVMTSVPAFALGLE